jgi:hypothetical protein
MCTVINSEFLSQRFIKALNESWKSDEQLLVIRRTPKMSTGAQGDRLSKWELSRMKVEPFGMVRSLFCRNFDPDDFHCEKMTTVLFFVLFFFLFCFKNLKHWDISTK